MNKERCMAEHQTKMSNKLDEGSLVTTIDRLVGFALRKKLVPLGTKR
jgi:hypothetical protein